MSTPDELRKIQLLEKRLLGGSQGRSGQLTQEMTNNSNSHGGGSSHSHSGGTGGTHETIKDQSHSLLLTKDGSMMGGGDENQSNIQEEKKESSMMSAEGRNSNSHRSGGAKNGSSSSSNSSSVGLGGQVIDLEKSDHSGSLSRISPLKPSAPNTAVKDTQGAGTESGKRKSSGGSSSAMLRDLNSVLKHVPGSELQPPAAGAGDVGGGIPSPKAQKIGHDGESTNGSASITILEKDGSRGGAGAGAGGVKRTIQSYFTKTHDTGAGGSSSSGIGGVGSSSSGAGGMDRDATMRSPPTVAEGEGGVAASVVTGAGAGAGGGTRRGSRAGAKPAAAGSSSSSSSTAGSDEFSEREVRRQIEKLKVEKDQAIQKAFRIDSDLKSALDRQKMLEERNIKIIKALETTYRDMARQEGRRRRDRLALDCVRLGKIVTMRTGPTQYSEVWEEGYALKDLTKRSTEFTERKDELHRRRSDLNKARTRAKKKDSTKIVSDDSNSGMGGSLFPWSYDNEHDLDLVAESEAIMSHLAQLKKDETALSDERRLLETEKAAHQKELKRCQSEDRSRFQRELPLLTRRYLLTSLLGRGGFSEVWKAMDLLQLKEVAIKIHQLNPSWSEERKQSYIKHVTREYTIHRDMKHPRVVQLFDVFEIDTNCFATVLEYCRGIDLDEKLKRMRLIGEKDARTILLQIISGLRYLNTGAAGPVQAGGDGGVGMGDGGDNGGGLGAGAGVVSGVGGGAVAGGEGAGGAGGAGGAQKRMTIIHYDLKPANILFDEHGDAKITDFGLSKIVDDSNEDESLELTSQGAGTYWYLPPECFAKGDANGGPRVSSKVDVWSVGVIYYQMLFGKRPFGEGKSQEIVLREGIMLNANQVEFPSDPKAPKITEEAKDFIRACLTHDKNHRPDVLQMCMHPYVSAKVKT